MRDNIGTGNLGRRGEIRSNELGMEGGMSGRGVTDAPGQWKIEARKERSVPWLAVRVLFGSWVKKKKKKKGRMERSAHPQLPGTFPGVQPAVDVGG